MSVLDDLKLIHHRDKSDAFGLAGKQGQQLSKEFGVDFNQTHDIQNIVLAGMGGSAWPFQYLQTWPGLKKPYFINRDYTIPEYVNQNTLFIASSYSGNTEETLSALKHAENQNAQIAVMASGGKLSEIAKSKGFPLFEMPAGSQPRMSSFYFIAGLIELLAPLGLTNTESINEKKLLSEWLQTQTNDWGPTTPTSKNYAKQLALELMGKTIIVYSGPLMSPAALKWKICMTENAKNLAWFNQYPELNHNEFTGWTGHPIDKPFGVVEIRSNLENERTQKRFKVTDRLLSGKRPSPQVIQPIGDSVEQQLFWASMLGDFVSLYMAMLNNVDPTPVDYVEKLKKELN